MALNSDAEFWNECVKSVSFRMIPDLTSNAANISAIIYHELIKRKGSDAVNWVGFYWCRKYYDEVKKGIKNIIETLGSVDILVNNAGIAAFGSLNDMEVKTWENIIQTNVMGMYYVTKEVLPYLIAKNEGDIIKFIFVNNDYEFGAKYTKFTKYRY